MNAPPLRLARAFLTAAAELGMASAARLFVREFARSGGPELVAAARDVFGREFPVFHVVATRWLAEPTDAPPRLAALLAAVENLSRLLVVGIEATLLDALLPQLRGVEVGLVRDGHALGGDFARVLANYDGFAVGVELADLQRWSGRRSGLMTFVYGSDGHVVHVPATWLRVSGPDVRTQFAAVLGWNILGEPMEVYPRWLAETSAADFSRVLGP